MALKARSLIHERGKARKIDLRGSSRARGYDRAWDKLSLAWRNEHPLCVRCTSEGRTTAGTMVDHIVPVRIAPARRLDRTNLQTLCDPCHGIKTHEDERRYA